MATYQGSLAIHKNFVDENVPGGEIRRRDPLEHAVEYIEKGAFKMHGWLYLCHESRYILLVIPVGTNSLGYIAKSIPFFSSIRRIVRFSLNAFG